jgi:hypothetical protein
MSGRMSESSQISEAIRKEAIDCKISAADMRNTPTTEMFSMWYPSYWRGLPKKLKRRDD